MEEINWQYKGKTEERNNVVVRPARSLSVSPFRRSAEVKFRRLFTDLPADEILLADYFCALDRGFLRQGRLFVTSRHLCFHASVFGFLETHVQLPWVLVTDLKKKKTAKVIPNAIQVDCAAASGQPPLRFCSFLSRRKSFNKLFNTWQQWDSSSQQFLVIADDFNPVQCSLLSATSNINSSSKKPLPLLPNEALSNLSLRVMGDLEFDDAVIADYACRKMYIFYRQQVVVEVDEPFIERLV
jgi:hypothetical protein